mgnify:CR=1 FL=1
MLLGLGFSGVDFLTLSCLLAASSSSTSKPLNLNSLSFQNNDLKIYPNPVKDILHIKSNNEIHTIAILSLTGRLIDTFNDLNTKSVQIPTNNIYSGHYIFQFETSNGVLNENIIVSK